jgi:predicted extracellular nuclease
MRAFAIRLRTRFNGRIAVCAAAAGGLAVFAPAAMADTTPQTLPFSQKWMNTGLITTDDMWTGVPGIVGYLGDDPSTTTTGIDPQTILADRSSTVDVIANQTSPNTLTNGGVAEFHISNAVVALQGSGTADAPHLVLHLDTTGASSVSVSYNLRDIDGSTDDAVQPVALQYRVGGSGNYTNVPAGYVADATTGPSLAALVTNVSVNLPAAAVNQPVVHLRIMTTNAASSDEWVGVEDISVTAADAAPSVTSTNPPSGATGVAASSDVSITFSEPVNVTGSWFSISCTTSGGHTASATGGPTTFTLNPDTNFAPGETCAVTVVAAQVTDQDTNDPPDNMAANYVFSFSVAYAGLEIHEIQGARHISPFSGAGVTDVAGIVTAIATNGFYMQDLTPDADDSTSEGIFVFTSSSPLVAVGNAVSVAGTVSEFRPGGAGSTNLTTTEITSPTVTTVSSGNPLPTATVIGSGGRVPPNTVIEDDASGDVEASGVFDPATDGIDFYESLEGMRVQLNNPVAVGPTNGFGEVPVIADDGTGASVRTARGGIVVRATDFNPERVILADALPGIGAMPLLDVRDHTSPKAVMGVMDYSFGNFKLQKTIGLTADAGGLAQETTGAPTPVQVAIATLNVENLDPADPPSKFSALATEIVTNLQAPDIVSLEEIQDNNGPTNDTVTDASATLNALISAITAAGGPPYAFAQIDPVDDQDGGEPGGNIRVAFIYRTDRGLVFVSKPGATPTTPNTVSGSGLQYSPGRIDPTNPAFNASRKPLAAEFKFNSVTLFVIANHFNSKGGDQPLFGHFQPPTLSSEVQRNQQAQVVNDFVDAILAAQPGAAIAVVGDLNDFEFSTPLQTLKGGVLVDLVETLPQNQRYTYVFDGNSQTLDHIVVSSYISSRSPDYDIVHLNAEFAARVTDHDPGVLRFDPTSPPTAVRAGMLSATKSGNAVVVRWRTSAEVGTLGFHVYRTKGAKRVRVSRSLIRALGGLSGRSYRFIDRSARGGRYWVQEVRADGSRRWYGPVLSRRATR